MPRTNEVVEALLQEYADLLSISDADPFRPRTYEKAARAIGGYHADLSTLDLKGLGDPQRGQVHRRENRGVPPHGSFPALEELRAQIPAGVRQMISIPTLGPKKALLLYRDLKIASVEELTEAIEAGRLQGMKGFGAKTEENILRGIQLMQQSGDRVLISVAMELAEEVVAELRALPDCRKCTYAGSLRRMAETIGDIDVLVASDISEGIMDDLRRAADHRSVWSPTARPRPRIQTTRGLQVDLRVVSPGVWGAALQYFTGSKAHNIRTREMAVRKGLKLSEYGLFEAKTGELIVAETEEEVYERLGLPWIPPTLREDRGEIEAALHGDLPDPDRAVGRSGATCTPTRTSPTAWPPWSRWWPRRPGARVRLLRRHRSRPEPVHAAHDRPRRCWPSGTGSGSYRPRTARCPFCTGPS